MADFSVNASKNIPPTKSGCSVKVECDSAGENCYCPTNNNFDEEVGYKGNATDEFNPIVPFLQLFGAVNVAAEATFGDGISAPQSTPELSKPRTPTPDTSIDEDAYDSFSLSLPPLPFWAGSVFASFSGGDSTPEQRGQFAAQNIAANFAGGGGLPSVPAVEAPQPNYNAIFGSSAPATLSLEGTYIQFSSE